MAIKTALELEVFIITWLDHVFENQRDENSGERVALIVFNLI